MKTPRGAGRGLPKQKQPLPTKTSPASLGNGPERAPASRRNLWIYVLLAAATVAVCAQVGQFDFNSYDDPTGVVKNVHVTRGITSDGILWALASDDDCNLLALGFKTTIVTSP
jgi:hypothetical protein